MQGEAERHPPLVMGVLREPIPGDTGLRLREQCKADVGSGFNFIMLPVSRCIPESGCSSLTAYEALPHGAFTRQAHKALSSMQWGSVVGVVDALVAHDSDDGLAEFVLQEAAQWAMYLGLHGIMLTLPASTGEHNLLAFGARLARVLSETQSAGFDIWIRLSWRQQHWHAWNVLNQCKGVTPGRRLHAVVDFSDADVADAIPACHLQRWFGEIVAAVLLPTSQFALDAQQEAAVLPAGLETVVSTFMHYPAIKWIIDGACRHRQGYVAYRHCLARIQARYDPPWEEILLRSSIDQLQQPLQPLHDHLASVSYEEFERDPVKYQRYEQAIGQALAERHANSASVTVMVLGAGRGPIVDAAVRASRTFRGEVRLFVIEKNPSAVVTLQHRARDDWADANVVIVCTDMRNWDTAERADIIVSELLGSWGDNELSPECLDGAQYLLKENGISIPASYTSYLAPITSAKLHTAVASRLPFGHPELGMRSYFESTYVVHMGAIFMLDQEQPCFTFTHPNPDKRSNERFARCQFTVPEQLEYCTVHGFRGTFSCRLYGEHVISIAEVDRSQGMFSWAPLYLPLERPFTVKGGTKLDVLLWRKTAPGKVWYEWMVKDYSHVHNAAGRSATIGVA
jgi:protein arginine N-methyltransferase 5